MTNEEAVKQIKGNCYFASISEKTKEALDMAIKALEAQPCIEDYPTCTECEHYDSEKHYCPRFCQVIKDTLAEAQPSEDTEVIKVSKGAVKARQGRFVIYDVEWLKKNFYTTEEKIYGQPKQPCEDAVSRQAVINTIFYKSDNSCDVVLSTDLMDRIKQLPSVTPQRPKGKWSFIGDQMLECSSCKRAYTQNQFEELRIYTTDDLLPKYCPNCGSYNGGGEDGEDSACD